MKEDTSFYPLRHISVRVPWHDNNWNGTVCLDPRRNGSCLRLARIAAERTKENEEQEQAVAGKSLQEIDKHQWPCCVTERMAIMAPFEYIRDAIHPYHKTSPETHGHFASTPLLHPSYSASAIPFRWMFIENMEQLSKEYGLNIDEEREPELPFSTQWVQEKENQLALLNCFFSHIRKEQSLCFFYSKEVPFVEDSRRVIIGIGRVKNVGEPMEYRYSRKGKIRSIVWERIIQHSIRPDFRDGFIFPYKELFNYIERNPDFEAAPLTAFAPEEYFEEFSYASEHVSHDGAIAALLSCAAALNNTKKVIQGNWEQNLKWIHDRLAELWKMRGPCPGLGAALCAFGIEYGTFVAREIELKLGENEDPWPFVDKVFGNPSSVLTKQASSMIGSELQLKWKHLPHERKALLKLVSRFSILPDQATILYVQEERFRSGIKCSDSEMLNNPYLIYDSTRLANNSVSVWTVDRGVFPESVIRNKHPLPDPSCVRSGTDSRRVEAFTVHLLEKAADAGHTLQTKTDIVLSLRDMPIEPSCPVDSDLMNVVEQKFSGSILVSSLDDGTPCYQLQRLALVGETIRTSINKRRVGKPHKFQVDWRTFLDKHLPPMNEVQPEDMTQEQRAREEKAAALQVLAESRFAVLIGPAGTGKTKLLSILCSHPSIAEGKVLLLAPTGKARVKMEQAAKESNLNLEGYTIAQFLTRCDRYDSFTGRYHLSTAPKESPDKTVIVDEASMLTEEMLAALIDALKGVERLILVGDPRQLPPIGPGRPFVDIISEVTPENVHTKFPRLGPGYAELTVRRRQAGQEREDIQLAQWFCGSPLGPGEDEIFDKVVYSGKAKHVYFKEWNTSDEVQCLLQETLIQELNLADSNDIRGFDLSLGATIYEGFSYFNVGAADSIENWQILSPVRKQQHGVVAINRWVHSDFRKHMLEFSLRDRFRKIPKPFGNEQIVYGDKVINIKNHKRDRVYPKEGATQYVANGEIGIVVGQFRSKKMNTPPWLLKVEFTSQSGFSYDYGTRDFEEESESKLELAYALTVHKAQGSEFGKVILILPNPCRLLSRELLYTALTRQQDRIVILQQGNRGDIKKYSSDEFSETAKRLTNLFQKPRPIEVRGKFYEERLIHKTLRGELVRSKSELVIADRLASHNIDYTYEKPLVINGETRYPDFTIEDEESGFKYYWEHCGMLFDPDYKKRWENKLYWYRKNGILPYEEGGGPSGILIVSEEEEGFSSQTIENIIQKIVLTQNYTGQPT